MSPDLTLDTALRATEILLALAFLQQCGEHILWSRRAWRRAERLLFLVRALLCLPLLFGVASPWVLLALSLHSLLILRHFAGPYNGGSDRMGLLVLYCLTLAELLPDGLAQEAAFGYLGIQVVLSYFISGQVKIVNPEWRRGRALQDVFRFSAYPVSESLRGLAEKPRLLWLMSWSVILFELVFPFSLLNADVLIAALVLAAMFHLSNACFFGLNRFVWFWVASYPSILWLQDRVIQSA